MNLPGRLGGGAPLAIWLNKLRDYCAANQVTSIAGGRFSRGPHGTQISINNQPRQNGQAQLFVLRTVLDDYLLCHAWTWNGTEYAEGAEDIFVAKPRKLRTTGWSETKCGLVHTYTFDDGPDAMNKRRKDDWVTAFEYQLVTPPWTLLEEIYAYPAFTTAIDVYGDRVLWNYDGPSRQWGMVAT